MNKACWFFFFIYLKVLSLIVQKSNQFEINRMSKEIWFS